MQQSKKTYRFILSGGGTGGHIFPALAIANELKKQLPNAEFLFVGAKGKMEMEKIPKAGYDIIGLPITGIQRKLSVENLKFPFRLFQSIQKAKKILKDFQPDLVIGTGGYASGPVLLAAQQKGVPTMIQEQNAFPGITNKKLGGKAKRVFVAYENMQKYFPQDAIRNLGNPVRSKMFAELPDQMQAKAFFGLDVTKPVVLSVGGSLGSRTLNNVWKENAPEVAKDGLQLIWQTGSLEYHTVGDSLRDLTGVKVVEFIHRMDMAYAAADVIVSRAGAIAISELTMVGKPMILVPFPFAAEDHQTKNAMSLVNEQAAQIVSDADAQAQLAGKVMELLHDKESQTEMAKNTALFAKPQATQDIVNEIIAYLG